MEAESSRLELRVSSLQRRMAHMQAPMMQMITKANRHSAALFAVQLQLHRQRSGAAHGAAVAAANGTEDDSAAACGSTSIAAGSSSVAQPAVSSASLSSPSTLLHVLVSNPSRESVECSARCLSLVVELRIAAAAHADGSASATTLSFASPFPEVRWTPRQSFQASFPIDAHLLTHALMQVRVKLRVRRDDTADPGFTDVVLRDWTIDAFDLSTPVLSSAALSAAATTAASAALNHKRKREDESNGGERTDDERQDEAARSPALASGSVNSLHQQSLLLGDARRVLVPPSTPLFGSVYSMPSWYRSRLLRSGVCGALAVPRPLSVADHPSRSSFQIVFAGPLQLGPSYQIKPGNISLVVPWLIRMLLSHLLPAHSLDCNESSIGSLLSGLTSSSLKAGSSSFVQFDLRWPGSSRALEWRVDFRVPSIHAAAGAQSASAASSPPQSILFVLRIRAPSPSLLPRVRSSVMQRLFKLLFQQSIPAAALASASDASDHAQSTADPSAPAAAAAASPSLSVSPVPAGWSSVHFRAGSSIASMLGPGASKEAHEAAAEAQRWSIAYIHAARAAHAQTLASSFPAPLLHPVQSLASQLATVRAKLQSLSEQQPPCSPSAVFDLFLSTRSQPQGQDVKPDLSTGANILGSMQCIVV